MIALALLVCGLCVGYVVGNIYPLHKPVVNLPKDFRYPSSIKVGTPPDFPPQNHGQ